MAKLSVAIMAHPRRARYVPELSKRLDTEAEVVWDRINDRWDTGRRAVLAADPGATHHLVLQDDSVVCKDLVAGLEEALDHIPTDSPACLYLGRVFRSHINHLMHRRLSWLTMPQIHWGVGIVLPTQHVEEAVEFGDTLDHVENYDIRLSRWAQSRSLTVYYPWPSLVEHRGIPSLVPGRGVTGRRAAKFIGETASALKTRWDLGVEQVRYQPRERPARKTWQPAPKPADRKPKAAKKKLQADTSYLIRTVHSNDRVQFPVSFMSVKNPDLEYKHLGIKFINGYFEAVTHRQVRYLLSTAARRAGVRIIGGNNDTIRSDRRASESL